MYFGGSQLEVNKHKSCMNIIYSRSVDNLKYNGMELASRIVIL
jgi:hypothetical protein